MRLSANSNSSMYGHEEEEESLEAQTIGNLLPDDDDLLSGVTDCKLQCDDDDDVEEELDFFSSVGGMDLGEERIYQTSRTLVVRNINSDVDDSELRILFEQYGEIQTLYTACGFVMISYYDIRASRRAMQALQNKLLGCTNLDIHYSIPKDNPSDKGTVMIYDLDPSVSNEELGHVFGAYGEVKEIRDGSRHKSIEFYDIRAAEAALHELNMGAKQMKLVPSKRPFPEQDLGETSALLPPTDFARDVSGLSHS